MNEVEAVEPGSAAVRTATREAGANAPPGGLSSRLPRLPEWPLSRIAGVLGLLGLVFIVATIAVLAVEQRDRIERETRQDLQDTAFFGSDSLSVQAG
jgi:hypothetical protein